MCETNHGCLSTDNGLLGTACCSEGICAKPVICQANKQLGDYCDNDSECFSDSCGANACLSENIHRLNDHLERELYYHEAQSGQVPAASKDLA